MKRILTSLTILTLLPFLTFASNVTWNFATASPSSAAVPNLTVSDLSQGNNLGTTTLITTISASSGYAGVSGGGNAGAAARTGSLNTAAAGSAYFEFTLTPIGSNTVNITGINFGSRSTGTGPAAFTIRTSLDNYASDYALGALSPASSSPPWTLETTSPAIVSGVSTAITLRIYGYDGTGSASVNTANWRIDDLSLTLTVEAAVVAPVELKNIKVSKKNAAAELSWQTATENNNSHFDIERSNDGVKFSRLDAVKGNGTTNIVQNYTFTDDAPLKNINYYRLRQVDFDGKETVYKTVSVNFGKNTTTKVYPSIAKDKINVEISGDKGPSDLLVVNLLGQVVKAQKLQNTEGVFPVNISDLPNGSYIMRIVSKNENISLRFEKQ